MASEEDEISIPFHEMGLDDRILEGIAKLGWSKPTLIQEKAIPFFLEGKDILARARTGSGKTGAFLVPLVHRILDEKANDDEQAIRALVVAPSKELCNQTIGILEKLTFLCKREVRCIDVSPQLPNEAQSSLLADNPDIVVGTPLRILGHINDKNINIKESLRYLIIDEADLLFTYEYDSCIETLLKKLPSIFQSFVTSATISENVKSLKKLVLHNPVILKLEEPPLPTAAQLTQYVIKVEDLDKMVLLQVLFHMKILNGKSIIFVNDLDKSFKVKMFLGQFGIRSCVLNSAMPATSRCHIVTEFNDGKYDIIIASDERGGSKKMKSERKIKKDKESGASRGIDFQYISNIINLDFPASIDNYIHRVGRTARGKNTGLALSMVSVKEVPMFESVQKSLKELMPEVDEVFQHFKFNLSQLDGFRYRVRDAWRRCTSIAAKDVQKIEIRKEIVNSSKLQRYFEENPKELEILRHDVSTRGLPSQPHLKHIPEYNVPQNLQRASAVTATKKKAKHKGKKKMDRGVKRKGKKKDSSKDPLRTLQFSGFKKKKK